MGQALIQVFTCFVISNNQANEILRQFQKDYPKREIKSVSICPNEPAGWFMTITYEIRS